jgi:hypothetical protein
VGVLLLQGMAGTVMAGIATRSLRDHRRRSRTSKMEAA